jgi:hypothetical protein
MLVFRNQTDEYGAASRTPFNSGDFLVGNWAGWAYNTQAQVDGISLTGGNSTNYALDDGSNAFSPVYFSFPFNDVMVLPNRTAQRAKRVGWRHTTKLTSMQAVINQGARQYRNDSVLFGNPYNWMTALDTRPDTNTGGGAGTHAGFKIDSDGHGQPFAAQMTGGWPTVSGHSTYASPSGGWTVMQVGYGRDGIESGYHGGGFGCRDAADTHNRLSHHYWGWGSGRASQFWSGDRSSAWYGHAVYVR